MRGQQPYFREHLLYINGEWVPQTDGEVMEDRNPADGSVMAMVHMGGRQDAEKALAAAYAARGKWAATAPDVRERLLLRAADEMEARRADRPDDRRERLRPVQGTGRGHGQRGHPAGGCR